MAQAQADLAALNERGRGKKRFQTMAPLREAAEAIVAQYCVEGLVQLSYKTVVHKRTVWGYRERPAWVERSRAVHVVATVNELAVEAEVRRLGWRVTATNHPPDHPSFRLTGEEKPLHHRSEQILVIGKMDIFDFTSPKHRRQAGTTNFSYWFNFRSVSDE